MKHMVFSGFLLGVFRLNVLLLTLTSTNDSEFMDLEGISLDVVPPVHDVELEGAERVPQSNKMRAMWTEDQQLA